MAQTRRAFEHLCPYETQRVGVVTVELPEMRHGPEVGIEAS